MEPAPTISRFQSLPLVAGLTRLCFGIAKKALLADPIGGIADAAFASGVGSLSTFSAWIGLIAFAFQVYLVFSAFSDMAIGVGKMFGVDFAENFDSPYKCDSVTGFWRRWLLPLGGNLFGRVIVTGLIGTLWHGAPLCLVVWGVLNVGLLLIERLTGGDAFYSAVVKPVRVAITFFLLLVTWVFFRAETLDGAESYLAILFGFGPVPGATALILEAHMLRNFNTLHLVICALGLWAMPNIQTILRKPTRWKTVTGLCLLAIAFAMGTTAIRQNLQGLLTRFGGEGNDKVHAGTSGWLFAKPEMTVLSGVGPFQHVSAGRSDSEGVTGDSVLKFAGKLKELGVPLLLVPVR